MDSLTILAVTIALVVCSWRVSGNKSRLTALEAEVAQLRALIVEAETEVSR